MVPRDPFDPDAPAISANVPMMIGTCLEDSGFTITDTSQDDASLRKWVENQLRPLNVTSRDSSPRSEQFFSD
jgi:para-nitrobenzyl esterase